MLAKFRLIEKICDGISRIFGDKIYDNRNVAEVYRVFLRNVLLPTKD
jgi:hypothetical protein